MNRLLRERAKKGRSAAARAIFEAGGPDHKARGVVERAYRTCPMCSSYSPGLRRVADWSDRTVLVRCPSCPFNVRLIAPPGHALSPPTTPAPQVLVVAVEGSAGPVVIEPYCRPRRQAGRGSE